MVSFIKRIGASLLRKLIFLIKNHPGARFWVLKVISKLRLNALAYSVHAYLFAKSKPTAIFCQEDENGLSPRTREIYLDLKQAIEGLKQEHS